MSTKRAVFLDRDGVINRYHYNTEFGTVDSPATPEQFELLPGAAEAIAELNQRGLPVIVVSNQPGIAKGKFSPRILSAITLKMVKLLTDAGAHLDDVLYCTHHPAATIAEHRVDCDCRKPEPGLLRRAAREWNLDLAGSFVIGDGVDDILAGNAAGATTLLVAPRRYAVCEEFALRGARPHRLVADLKQAAHEIDEILAGSKQFPSVAQGVATDAGQIGRTVELLREARERGVWTYD
jgi:D-glycero-D-manno-heptose 1,7-bisphosphate phosphatase